MILETYTGKQGYDAKREIKRLVRISLKIYNVMIITTEIWSIVIIISFVKVDLFRDTLYDVEEFIKISDPIMRSTSVPHLEIQSLCRKTLSVRSKRIEMEEVRLRCIIVTFVTTLYMYRFWWYWRISVKCMKFNNINVTVTSVLLIED